VRQTLTSTVNLEKVVRATRLGDKVTNDKQMESAVAGLATQIKVVSQQDNLFEISATSGRGSYTDAQNAKLAQDIVQKMIDIFREENLAGGRGEMTDSWPSWTSNWPTGRRIWKPPSRSGRSSRPRTPR
jgi:D-Tyr-tRNAtyr deacylase